MRTDDALNLLASSLALILFTLCMAEFAEPSAVFFGYTDLPAFHGAPLSLSNLAAKEFDVRKAGRDNWQTEAALSETMLLPDAPRMSLAAIPVRWRPTRTMRARPLRQRPRRVRNS